MSLRKYLVAVLLSCGLVPTPFTVSTASALDPRKNISQYVHDVWSTKEGLPQRTVQAIVQTQDGYLWLGTQEGVVRFDGVRFTVFNKLNTSAIKHNDIKALCEGRDGELWIGTRKGLIRFKDGTFTTYTTNEGLSENYVTALVVDRSGTLWVGTNSGGLNSLKNGKFKSYTAQSGLSSDGVAALCEGEDGSLWIGTPRGGLNRLKDERFDVFTISDGLSDNSVRSLYKSADGGIWVGTNRGLNQFINGKFVVYTIAQGLSGNEISSISSSRDGALWIGTLTNGLNRLQDGKFTSHAIKDGPGGHVMSILEDREGSLWIGMANEGLNRFHDGDFTTFGTAEGLSDNMTHTFHQSRDGGLWIGTAGGGLNLFKDGKFIHYRTKDGLAGDYMEAIYEDRKGAVWIGTRQGLNRFENGKFTLYTYEDGLTYDRAKVTWPNNQVKAIIEDRQGQFWVGALGGLYVLTNGEFHRIPSITRPVTALLEDKDGGLWIGSSSGSVSFFKDGQLTEFELTKNMVMALYEDSQGTLWIGTHNDGLIRFKDGKATRYTTHDGLFDDSVFGILEDDHGNLWMSCNRGIFRVNKKELDTFAEGQQPSISSYSYGTADGLKDKECNGGFQNAAYKTVDGRLWFATGVGVAVIDPNHTSINALPPPVHIEEIVVNQRALTSADSNTLGTGTKEIEIHYTGLSFQNPEKMAFKYKLEGFDTDWVDAGTRRVAYYTNIPPGNYQFRVIASNNDGVWNETGASFGFYLQPHFYQTKWFYAVCALALLFLAFGLYRFRVRQLRLRTQQLEVTVEQRTEELKKSQKKVLKLEKQATEQQMAGGFAHEMRNALAGPKLVLDHALALDGPEPHVSLNLANCHNLKEMYLELKDILSRDEAGAILKRMQAIFSNEERVEETMQLVRKATSRGLKITQQIMDYSRIGQHQQGQQRVDLTSLIISVVDESREEFSARDVVVNYIPNGNPASLVGDENHFHSIVKNIVLNARDALIDPGLNGRERRIEISTAARPHTLEIVIRDNGVGIAEENLAKIFEPFFSTKPATGTGLGLGMVKKIVSLYDGNISLSSKLGEGTTVTVSFPISSAL